jgi:hypothetical protein
MLVACAISEIGLTDTPFSSVFTRLYNRRMISSRRSWSAFKQCSSAPSCRSSSPKRQRRAWLSTIRAFLWRDGFRLATYCLDRRPRVRRHALYKLVASPTSLESPAFWLPWTQLRSRSRSLSGAMSAGDIAGSILQRFVQLVAPLMGSSTKFLVPFRPCFQSFHSTLPILIFGQTITQYAGELVGATRGYIESVVDCK